MKTEILTFKKLKKDGSIDASVLQKLVQFIKSGKLVVLPVDYIYGVVGILNDETLDQITSLAHTNADHCIRMVSSFKMLEEISFLDKLEFDFLHRIWPGELIVYLKDLKNTRKTIPIRMPKSKYQIDLMEMVGKPLLYCSIIDAKKRPVYKKNMLSTIFKGKVDLKLIIDEFCKNHTPPSIVDISTGELSIIEEGRISSEEIKSLYFLGKDDSEI